MKIELVGGPECGEVREVRYLNPLFQIGTATYARRDTAWALSSRHGALYGERGARFYDAVKGGGNGE